MATTNKLSYGTSNQTITITLASQANNGQRSSAAVDNTANLFKEVLVHLVYKTGASGVASTGYVNVYAYGTNDGGSTYGGGETSMGTDAAVTLVSPPNLVLVAVLTANANATTYKMTAIPIAARAFGGALPDHWGLVVENKTGATSDTTGGNFAAKYQGVLDQNV